MDVEQLMKLIDKVSESDRLMDKSIFHAFDTSNKFYSACCSKQVTDHGFRRVDEND